MTDTLARMRQLTGTTAQWAANDLVLGDGEVAVERRADLTVRIKVGDGLKRFSQLPYSPSELRNALRTPFGDVLNDLPAVASRAGMLLGFAAGTGQPIAAGPVSGSASDLALALGSPTGDGNIGTTLAPVPGAKPSRNLNERNDEVYFSSDFAGVDPTGVMDSTVGLQAAFTAARAQGGKMKTLRIQTGTYKLTNTLITGSNLHVICEAGVTLDFSGLPNETTTCISLAAQSNVYFEMNGATIKGARATATPSIEGSSSGFTLYGAKNVVIRQAICTDCTTDGIYIAGDLGSSGPAQNVLIDQCVCTNNRRNGLSITHARNVLILGGLFDNSNGAPNGPFAGIDIEPDAGQTAASITLVGVRTSNNAGAGLLFVPSASSSVVGNFYGVTVHGGSSSNDGSVAGVGALTFASGGAFTNQVYGQIVVKGFHVISPKSRGVNWKNWDPDKAPRVICDDVLVTNPDATGVASGNLNRVGFAIYSDSTQVVTALGNIVLKDCRAEDMRPTPRMVEGFWLDVDPGHTLKNIRIVDPVSFNFTGGAKIDVNAGFPLDGSGVDVDVVYTAPRAWAQGGSFALAAMMGKRVQVTANGTVTLPTAASCKGSHYEVTSAAGVTTTLSAVTGETISGIGLTAAQTQTIAASCGLLVRSNGGTSWSAQPIA